jgi:hypothetical protein
MVRAVTGTTVHDLGRSFTIRIRRRAARGPTRSRGTRVDDVAGLELVGEHVL